MSKKFVSCASKSCLRHGFVQDLSKLCGEEEGGQYDDGFYATMTLCWPGVRSRGSAVPTPTPTQTPGFLPRLRSTPTPNCHDSGRLRLRFRLHTPGADHDLFAHPYVPKQVGGDSIASTLLSTILGTFPDNVAIFHVWFRCVEIRGCKTGAAGAHTVHSETNPGRRNILFGAWARALAVKRTAPAHEKWSHFGRNAQYVLARSRRQREPPSGFIRS